MDMVVLHYTVLDAGESLARLCDPQAEVSCHWLVDRDGAVTGLVDEGRRAWHAGRSRWGGVRDVNARSRGESSSSTTEWSRSRRSRRWRSRRSSRT